MGYCFGYKVITVMTYCYMPDTSKYARVSVRLEAQDYAKFQAKCAKQDLTMSQILRKYIKTEINNANT